MSAVLVNATGKQNFDGSASTTLSTDAYSLTAGNFSVVVMRTNLSTATGITVSDTAGNSYTFDGFVAGLAVWSCGQCHGHASNVVTVTYPAIEFTAVTALQFSGVRYGRRDAFASATVTSGATVSCVPRGRYRDQLVIVASDREFGGLPTFSPTMTTVYSSGPTGNGPYIGIGSHSVAYQTNSTQQFNGTESVTSTWSDASNGKHIFAVIYSLNLPINYGDDDTIEAPRILANITHTIHIGADVVRLTMPIPSREAPRVQR